VAGEAEFVAGEGQQRRRVGVDLVAVEAAQCTVAHVALDEVVALHAVLVELTI